MNLTKLMHLSIRNLFRNIRRTIITILIISAGFTALSLVAGYVQNAFVGLKEMTIRSTFTGSGGTGHFQIFRKEMLTQEENYPLEFGIDNYKEKIKQINSLPHILFVTPRIEFNGLISNGEKSISFLGLGIDPEHEANLRRWAKATSEIDNSPLYELKKDVPQVLLGSQMAKILKAKKNDWLQVLVTTVYGAINVIDLEVVGTLSSGSKTVDRYFLLTNIPTVEKVIQTDKVNRLVIFLDNSKYSDTIAQQALNTLTKDEPNVSYIAPKWYELGEYYHSIKAIYIIIFTFMSSVIFVIVMLSCNNTLLMSMMERIQEIGTLRAIGISIKWIKNIFIIEGIILGAISSILGFVFQGCIAILINVLKISMPPPPGTNIAYTLLIEPLPKALPLILLFIISSTTIASVLTFKKVKKMSIVEALNHT